ncbi:MAG TPA: hypothetical protein VMS18_22600 [Candidatus Binatia bacterium]|nr:hypothetical protein [Candidatus Binatia bacterium]
MLFLGIAIYWKLAEESSVGPYGKVIFVLMFTATTWMQLALSTPPKAWELTASCLVAPLVLSAIACGSGLEVHPECPYGGAGP